jgi:hypothetical protein
MSLFVIRSLAIWLCALLFNDPNFSILFYSLSSVVTGYIFHEDNIRLYKGVPRLIKGCSRMNVMNTVMDHLLPWMRHMLFRMPYGVHKDVDWL